MEDIKYFDLVWDKLKRDLEVGSVYQVMGAIDILMHKQVELLTEQIDHEKITANLIDIGSLSLSYLNKYVGDIETIKEQTRKQFVKFTTIYNYYYDFYHMRGFMLKEYNQALTYFKIDDYINLKLELIDILEVCIIAVIWLSYKNKKS